MHQALRAGIAIHNAGEFHAAHDAWEDYWLDLPDGTDDERFLHGLIQFTAAIHHARNRNWSGAQGLAESAGEYLAALPADYRDVNVGEVRSYLTRLVTDPESVERTRPLALTHEGETLRPADLDFEPAAIAAGIIAEEYDRYDEERIETAIDYAEEELADGTETQFITLVMDFAANGGHRDLIYQRLTEHIEQRERKARDVEGLFD